MLSTLLNVLFPSRCPVCDAQSDSHEHNPLCAACWQGIKPYAGPACLRCALPTASPQTMHCEACLARPPAFSQIVCYGIYEGALKEAIHLFKFGKLRRLAKPLGQLLEAAYSTTFSKDTQGGPLFDGIIPVPLSSAGLREREFNQAALLGLQLSRRLGIPLLLDKLEKSRETPPQAALHRKERMKNIKNAFRVSGDVQGKRVLLLDDVVTTSATVGECARVLKTAGAQGVTVLALARSMPKHLV